MRTAHPGPRRSLRSATTLLFAAIAAVATLAACAEKVSSPSSLLEPGTISLTVVSGDGQTGVAGQELPQALIVKVVSSNGKGVPGQLVNFRVTSGGGTMYAGASMTDTKGQAEDYWTLGPTRGAQRIDVVAVDPTSGAKQNFGTFTATALAPAALSFSPSSFDFGVTFTNVASPPHAFTLTNTGDQTSAVPTISFTGTNAADFKVTANTCAAGLAGGASCTVTVADTPLAGGAARSGNLVATGSPGGSASSSLTSTTHVSAALQISPSTYDFGSVTGGVHQFTISVVGGDIGAVLLAFSITGTNAGDFSVVDPNVCSSQVPPGGSCIISVAFSPTALGSRSATLTATSPSATSVSATLSGTSVTPANLSISPTSFDFGTVTVSQTSAQKVFTVSNSGQASSGNLFVGLSGNSAGDFNVVTTTCNGVSLGQGQSCTVTVTFGPTATGSRSATLSVDLGKPGSGPTASLGGTGG